MRERSPRLRRVATGGWSQSAAIARHGAIHRDGRIAIAIGGRNDGRTQSVVARGGGGRSEFHSIDLLRGLAALAVLVFHYKNFAGAAGDLSLLRQQDSSSAPKGRLAVAQLLQIGWHGLQIVRPRPAFVHCGGFGRRRAGEGSAARRASTPLPCGAPCADERVTIDGGEQALRRRSPPAV